MHLFQSEVNSHTKIFIYRANTKEIYIHRNTHKKINTLIENLIYIYIVTCFASRKPLVRNHRNLIFGFSPQFILPQPLQIRKRNQSSAAPRNRKRAGWRRQHSNQTTGRFLYSGKQHFHFIRAWGNIKSIQEKKKITEAFAFLFHP